MSPTTEKAAHNLSDYAPLLGVLGAQGLEFVVIGGLAVGSYAHMLNQVVQSADLDLYASASELQVILSQMRRLGIHIRKEPVPREIPVALFEWEGLEVYVLSSSRGLPTPDAAQAAAREFTLKSTPGVSVLVADPFHLLANKLAVNRPKDQPHITVLLQFIEEELVEAMRMETEPRKRLLPAKRLLNVLGQGTLEEHVMARLLDVAKQPTDFRFLAGASPSREWGDALLLRAPDAETRADITQIVSERFSRRRRQ